jgi:hypothetical protein
MDRPVPANVGAAEARMRQAVLRVVYAYQTHGSAFRDYDPITHSLPAIAFFRA